YTLALVMVVFAMVFSMAAAQASMTRALNRTIETVFGSDLQGWSPNGVNDELLATIRSTPHVSRVSQIWYADTHLTTAVRNEGKTYAQRNADPRVFIIDPVSYFAVSGLPWTDGT